ncbi:hypothetical protein MKW92_027526 [Papaver armeniacum]|nr:hypothetical protein MKW92_027526 [Papaver armeniacum]
MNHTRVLLTKLIWRFELFLREDDIISVLASAEPKLHLANGEYRDISNIMLSSRTWSFFTEETWVEKSLRSLLN